MRTDDIIYGRGGSDQEGGMACRRVRRARS